MSHSLTIGKLAKKADVSTDSIRFYEQRGLLAEPIGTESSYRVYPLEVAGRLRFIKKAQKLGFSLGEIQELLNLSRDPAASKADVKRKTVEKIEDIKNRIQDLSRMLRALQLLNESCDEYGSIVECPILKALAEDDDHECHHKRQDEVIYERDIDRHPLVPGDRCILFHDDAKGWMLRWSSPQRTKTGRQRKQSRS
jgi:DNA-binding transcriptional MerR regulator